MDIQRTHRSSNDSHSGNAVIEINYIFILNHSLVLEKIRVDRNEVRVW